LSLITIDSEHLGIPDTNYSSIITLSSNEFTRICKELFALSETVIIETTANYVKFIVSSEVIGGSIKLENNEADDKEEKFFIKVKKLIKLIYCKLFILKFKVDEPVSLAFALRYLNMFTKAAQLSQQVFLYYFIFSF
jgi:proliferating cell nuclear antigen